jgi:hypothetical protein
MKQKRNAPESNELGNFLRRVTNDDLVVEVALDEYDYFLDVLPPRWMSGSLFAFAEGITAFRLFWRIKQRYFARQLSFEETQEFCRLSEARLVE